MENIKMDNDGYEWEESVYSWRMGFEYGDHQVVYCWFMHGWYPYVTIVIYPVLLLFITHVTYPSNEIQAISSSFSRIQMYLLRPQKL